MAPRIAVLGCGYWGNNHIRTLKSLGALAAVCDIDPSRSAKFAADYDVEQISVDDLFSAKHIDAIVMALPAQFHAQYAIRAVENGKDVLVEKPIALTVADGEAEIAAARKYGCIFMVGHILRFHPAFEKLLQLAQAGELGKIGYIQAHRIGLGKFHGQNDALWDLAPHDLSMILALTGCEPDEIRGEGAAIIDHLSDFAHLHMHFPNGIRSHLFASRLNPIMDRRLAVIGDKAMAVFDDAEPWERKLALYRHKIWQENGQIAFTKADPDYMPLQEGMPLTRELEHFIHCIETRETPRTNGEEAVSVLRILTKGTVHHPAHSS